MIKYGYVKKIGFIQIIKTDNERGIVQAYRVNKQGERIEKPNTMEIVLASIDEIQEAKMNLFYGMLEKSKGGNKP